VDNEQVGGAYGGKAFLPAPVACATAVAAARLNRPVLCQLDRNTDMTALGHRPGNQTTFSLTVDPTTLKFTSLALTATCDAGYDGEFGSLACTSLNAYVVPGANLKANTAVTSTPVNTIMRTPGDFQGCLFMEVCVEAGARAAGCCTPASILAFQEANLSSDTLPVWNTMKSKSNVSALIQSVSTFNANNRWRKRGLWCMPLKFSLNSLEVAERVVVSILADGSVAVAHSGIELGQGINTKVIQAISMALSKVAPVAMNAISTVLPKSTNTYALATPTWSSTTSEGCVAAAIQACAVLTERLQPFVAPGDSFAQVVEKATQAGADLSADALRKVTDGGKYFIYGASCASAELDVLTGEVQVGSGR
jgi:xanthine dehydrogenase/oxidase